VCWYLFNNGLCDCSGLFIACLGCAIHLLLGSVWLGGKVGWDGPNPGSWDGMTSFSVWLTRDGANPFFVWCGDLKSGICH